MMDFFAPRAGAVVGAAFIYGVDEPVVQRPMVFVFEAAQAVRDAFDGILEAVRPVVHRIDAPLIALPMMFGVQNAVHHRVAHIQVRVAHIDLCAKRARAVRKFACLRIRRKQVEIFFDAAIAIRAVLAGPCQRAAIFADLVAGKIADIRLALFDKFDCPLVHLLEIVACEKQPVIPFGPQPADILDNGIDKLLLFLDRIGIVKAQIEKPAELGRDSVIDPDGLCVADMQICVRLRRKTGMDRLALQTARRAQYLRRRHRG